MSSETSTESRLSSPGSGSFTPAPVAGDLRASGPDSGSGASTSRSEPLQPWQLFTLAGLVGATIVVFLSRGQTPAGVVLLSLIVFAAAAVGVAALRTFLPLSTRNPVDVPQVLGGRTRAALERDKALVLRALKELEFDRAMGKISDKDFGEMSGRLRARATRLIRQLDAGAGYRQQIEQEIERRLGPAPATAAVAEGPESPPARLDQPGISTSHTASDGLCSSCQTTNDPDARFCKGCGQRLEAGA